MDLITCTNLDPREYEHPSDQRALDMLQRTKGLDTLVKKFYEFGIERIMQIQCTGSNLKVTSSSFPELYEQVEETCQILHLMHVPQIYLQPSEDVQGLTTGIDRPIIILSTACLDSLSDAETRFIIGRQIGHIKSRHVLYYEIGLLLPVLTEILAGPSLGIGALISLPLQIALLNWMRMSEYTADRAGLLACQDAAAMASALAKVAGLPTSHHDSFNVDDFVTQAREFEGFDADKLNKTLKYASLLFAEQHWAVARAHELFEWIDAGLYKQVLNRQSAPRQLTTPASTPTVSFCTQCGFQLSQPGKFCPQCGQPTSQPNPAV